VQTGFGRTGALFASEHYGIEPDIFVTAKSLGGGLPLAAITGRAEIMDAPQSGGLGGTFGGNPLSCVAALAVLDVFENENENLSARANELGNRFQRKARDWQRRWPMIGDVRGLGAMQAMELVQSADTRQPAPEETKQIVQYCYEHGLIILSAGSYSNVIRALMPLVITDAQMDEALAVLESALQTVCERKEAAVQPA
jgi:4-aminobutyrate aminotransferase/(S)-3-amino-2-methylpropionate transaminase